MYTFSFDGEVAMFKRGLLPNMGRGLSVASSVVSSSPGLLLFRVMLAVVAGCWK